jgi:PAS domain S-box-containing protein
MNSASRLVFLGLASVGIFAALLYGQYTLTRQVGALNKHAVTDSLPRIVALEDIRVGVYRIVLSTHETVHKANIEIFDSIDRTAEAYLLQRGKETFAQGLAQYEATEKNDHSHDSSDFLEELYDKYDRLVQLSDGVISAGTKDAQSRELANLMVQFEVAELAILDAIEQQLVVEAQQATGMLADSIKQNDSTALVIVMLGVVAIGVVGLYGTYSIGLVRNLNNNEKRLKENEQRFRDFAEASGDWFWEIDDKLRYSYLSARVEEVTGVAPLARLGRTRAEIGAPGVDEEVYLRHLDDLENHRPFRDFQHARTKPDGSTVYLSTNGRPVFDEDGTFKGYRGTGADVTNQKVLTQEIVEKRKIAELLENVASSANHATGSNEALAKTLDLICNFTGWPVGHAFLRDEERELLAPTDIWHVADPERYAAFVDETMQTRFRPDTGLVGRVFATAESHWVNNADLNPEFLRRRSAGEAGIKAGFAVPVLIDNRAVAVMEFFDLNLAEPDEALLQVMSQVGVQLGRVFEREMLEQSNRLHQQFIQSITMNLAEGILVIERGGRIRFSNPAAQRLLMCEGEATLEGRHADEVFRLFDRGTVIPFVNGPFLSAIVGGKQQVESETTFVIGGDRLITVAYACAPMRSRHGEEAAVMSFRDISDLKKAQNDALRASKLASVGELAAGIAHEINSPIQFIGDNLDFIRSTNEDIATILSAYERLAEAAREKAGIDEQLEALDLALEAADVAEAIEDNRDAAEQSLRGVERISRIVRAMKEFSHPGGREAEQVDLNHAIESTTEVCRNEWKTNAELELDFQEDLPLVHCFAGELNQVFLNMVVNASHAIREARQNEMGRIRITTRQTGEDVEIRITDNGGGIPESVRDKIFDPFFTTKEVGKGTGQGLAISHDVVVNMHGGRIDLQSTVGEGTTFIVTIPIDGRKLATEAA